MFYFFAYIFFSVAYADENNCYDQKGQVVSVIYNYNSPNLAVALEKSDTASITVINPSLMKKFSPQTQTFIRWHECGHHMAGDLINNSSTTIPQEQIADCTGVRIALTLSQINHSDLEIIQREISNIGPGDWSHLSGQVRSMNISKCLGEGIQEKPWKDCREKFYSNLNTFKSATPVLKKMRDICKKLGNKSTQCLDAKKLSLQLHQGLISSTATIDQQCKFIMDPAYTRVLFDYGKVFKELNN